MSDTATASYSKMQIDEKIKERLADLVVSKSQDDKKINELIDKAETLKKRLHIDTND